MVNLSLWIFILYWRLALSQTILQKCPQSQQNEIYQRVNDLIMLFRKQNYKLQNIAMKRRELIDENKAIKIYFHVWNSVTLDNIKPGTIIKYDVVVTNKGDGYNRRTGNFTAPRDGPYVFTWTVLTTREHKINLHLVVPGRYEYVAQADGTSGTSNGSGSNTVVLELKKGDVVYVKCGDWGITSQNLLYGYAHSTFSGWTI